MTRVCLNLTGPVTMENELEKYAVVVVVVAIAADVSKLFL